MSKKVKNLITGELAGKLKALQGAAVISPRGIDGIKNNQLRRRLRERGLHMTVVKNSLARRALSGTPAAGIDKLLDGPSAVIHISAGKETATSSMPAVARMLLEEKKTNDKLELRGIFFDGEIYEGQKGVEQASKMPTRQEAIASLVAQLLGPGRRLAGAIKGPGGKLGGVLKTIETKAKEKEGAVAPAAPAA
jgi:ribosomal protein L10